MDTHRRSLELDTICREMLDEMGLNCVTDPIALHPAVIELRRRTGIQLATARSVIARHIRRYRGLIVGDYQVQRITTLPHRAEDQVVPGPVVEIKETK